MLAHGIRGPKQACLGPGSEHADRSSAIFFLLVEESAIHHLKGGNRRVSGIYTINGGKLLLRFRDGLSRDKPFAGSGSSNVANVVTDNSVILEGKAGRGF